MYNFVQEKLNVVRFPPPPLTVPETRFSRGCACGHVTLAPPQKLKQAIPNIIRVLLFLVVRCCSPHFGSLSDRG